MLNAIPLSPLCLLLSLFGLLAQALLLAQHLLHSAPPHRLWRILQSGAQLLYFSLWALLFSLQAGALTPSAPILRAIRWSMLLPILCSVLLALREQEWTNLLPALFDLLTLPFFETAFGLSFRFILPVMLALSLLYAMISLIRQIVLQSRRLSARSVQQALDTLQDGILFARSDGSVLLCNRAMRALSDSIFHRPIENAQTFWQEICDSAPSSGLVTKVAAEGSFLFRFTGGSTWTLHRQSRTVGEESILQITALDVTQLDQIQAQIAAQSAAISQLQPKKEEILALQDRLQEAEALVALGRQALESSAEKLCALDRFLTERTALEPKEYTALASLTDGLLPQLTHAAPLTPPEQLANCQRALHLIGVSLQLSGFSEETAAQWQALLSFLRSAIAACVLHAGSSELTLCFDPQSGSCTLRANRIGPQESFSSALAALQNQVPQTWHLLKEEADFLSLTISPAD